MSTQIYCDRCAEPLVGPAPIKSLLIWRWRGGMPADAEQVDMCQSCREEFVVWLNFEPPVITVELREIHHAG